MEDRFMQAFEAKLREKGLIKEAPPHMVAWRITEQKRVKRHKAVAFRLTDRAAAALTSLAESTGTNKTNVIEKLILSADLIMRQLVWDEVDETMQRERRDSLIVETVSIISKPLCDRR